MTKIILKEWTPESEPDCSNCKYGREELEWSSVRTRCLSCIGLDYAHLGAPRMTSEHIRQMREMRAEKNKLEAERDHWMNEAIDLRRDLESLKEVQTEKMKIVRKIAVDIGVEYLSIDMHGFTLAHGLLKGRLKHYLERLDKVLK